MKVKFKKLNHIQICIPIGKEQEAKSFYGDFLGLEEIEKPDELKPNGGMWYQIADIQLHIGVEDSQNNSKRHPAFEVEGLHEIKKLMIQKGLEIREEIVIPGVNRFSFYDPFGNRIELMEFIDNDSKENLLT